jgi:hypothetical protein
LERCDQVVLTRDSAFGFGANPARPAAHAAGAKTGLALQGSAGFLF